jgi:hypothetical protein
MCLCVAVTRHKSVRLSYDDDDRTAPTGNGAEGLQA